MYYNIDDILCEEHQVECRLEMDLYKGAFLDQEAHTDDGNLEKGHVMKLPFWMAKVLSEQEFDGTMIAAIEMLEMFEDNFQQALDADPTIINLRQQSDYFYSLGFKIADLIPNDLILERFRGASRLRTTLIESMSRRSLEIMFKMAEAKQDDVSRLTRIEKLNFHYCRQIKHEYEEWKDKLFKRAKIEIINKKVKF